MFIFVVNGITVLYCIIFRVFIREGRLIPNSYFYLGGGEAFIGKRRLSESERLINH